MPTLTKAWTDCFFQHMASQYPGVSLSATMKELDFLRHQVDKRWQDERKKELVKIYNIRINKQLKEQSVIDPA